MDTLANARPEATDKSEGGEKTALRPVEVTAEGRWALEYCGLDEKLIRELTDIMGEYEYGDAIPYAEWIVQNRVGVRFTPDYYEGAKECISIPNIYNFSNMEARSGQCSELMYKLKTRLELPGEWLDRANSKRRYYDDNLILHTIVGRSPKIFSEGDSPHFWIGLTTQTKLDEVRRYQEEEQDDEYNDGYNEETDYDDERSDDDAYDEDYYADADNDPYEQHPLESAYIPIDPAFGVVCANGEGYGMHDVFEDWTPKPESEFTDGMCFIDEYTISGGVLESQAMGATLRSSADHNYFFAIGFARATPDAILEPMMEVDLPDSSTVKCLRRQDGAYIWSARHEEVNEATKQEVYQLLEIFTQFEIQ